MNRIWSMMLALVLVLSLFVGCAQAAPSGESGSKGKLKVVSTIFPGYDFTRAVAGERVELKMLLPPGSESHSYEPTPQDIIAIQNCDVFLYVGGDSDTWVNGILDSMDTSNMTILSMMDLVDVVEEEMKEGMEDDHGHDHSHDKELQPEDVHDRPLSDWAGSWSTIEKALTSGALDEYVAHKAEENELDAAAQKTAFASRWKSEYATLTISGDTVSFRGSDVNYQYAGYKIVESDHGASVWYGFEAAAPASGAPKYIAFSDHGTGGHEEHEEEDKHHEETPHFHLRYGNESFEALTKMEDWAPTYFPADADGKEVAEAMGGHSHSEEEAEYDEHVWTSPVNAMRITQAISDTLCKLDAANAPEYQQNTTAYLGKLKELDASLRELAKNAPRRTLIFGDRFPFRYFVDEYGLDYFAAFPGCSTETEASAQTVAFLINKVKEEKIPSVLHIELSNEKMADTICESTGAKKLLLHSCHNVTRDELKNGITYLDLMNQNMKTLKEALS